MQFAKRAYRKHTSEICFVVVLDDAEPFRPAETIGRKDLERRRPIWKVTP